MTDRDRWGLRGRVRECRLQRTWYSGACGTDRCEAEERGDTTDLEFRNDGSVVWRRHTNHDGSEWTSTYEYDGAGRLVTVRTHNAAGRVDLQRHEYDDAGRLTRIVEQSSDASARIAESFEYDATGQKTKTIHVDVRKQTPNTTYSWGVDGTDCFYSAPGAARLAIAHNANDQPIELLFHDKNGRTVSRVEFSYDEESRLVEEAQTMIVDAFPAEMLKGASPAQLEALRALYGAGVTRRVHRYDARGRRIETHMSMLGTLSRDSKRMTYNDHGDLIAELSEYEQCDWNIDDQGQLSDSAHGSRVSRSEARFQYDYDVRGNWIKKVVQGRSGADQEFRVSTIEERTLAYYE